MVKVVDDTTTIPEDVVTQNDLSEWYSAADELKKIKFKEITLRKRIFGFFFKDPTEGTNNHDMDDGYTLKGVHKIDRKVDEGAFNSLKDKFRESGINPDTLVEMKPSLVKAQYNKLTEEQRHLVDQMLIIKPGSPSISIVKPKAKAKAGDKV